MTPMTPEEAQRWLEEELYEGRVPQVHVRRALQTIAYTDSDGITLSTGEDLDLGPHQAVRRWVGEWEEI